MVGVGTTNRAAAVDFWSADGESEIGVRETQ
jgi:hypothetical protein